MLTPKTVGRAIKFYREQAELSQRELAKRLGGGHPIAAGGSTSPALSVTGGSVVANWEYGRQFPTLGQLVQVARILDIEVSDIILTAEGMLE